MTTVRKLLGSITAAALLVTSTAPALARPYYGGGYGGHYRHHHDGDGFGNFLLGALLVGGVVAVASAASKDKQARDGRSGSDSRGYPGGPVYGGEDRRNWSDAENDAANVCADAAERVSSKSGNTAQVDDIDRVDRDGEGYRVDGVMRDGRAFNCGVRYGDLTYIQFRDRVALR